MSGASGPLFVATASFMVAIAASLVLSWHLMRHLPRMAVVTGIVVAVFGGLTLWLELDPSVDGMQVFNEARKKKIAILPGIMCSTTNKYKNFIRISCGFRWSEAIENGIATLGKIVADLI